MNQKDLAPLRLYVLGANQWRDEQEWPLTRARNTSWYLSSSGHANSAAGDGVLTERQPTSEARDVFVSDPTNPVPSRGGTRLGFGFGVVEQTDVEGRPDVLVYTTEPLSGDLEVTGPIAAELHVAASTPTADFTVKLVDVHPDGSAYNVSDGILRWTGTAGKPVLVQVELWPTSMLFRRGHRMRIEVAGSNFPRFDRNLHVTETGAAPSFVPSTQAVYHGALLPSRVILPVVDRPDGRPYALDSR
jgi:putative CocE/NonD family hydrolase